MESVVAEKISEAELAVMEVLWSADAPLTASEVAERIGADRDWSDRTVKTMLARLLAKGTLAHEEDGRRYLYRPIVGRDRYVAGESRRFIDRLFGGRAAPLIAHLAESDQLTRADLDELEALLKELKA